MLRLSRIVRQQAQKYVPPSEKAILGHTKFSREKQKKDRLGKYIQYGVGAMVGGSLLMYLWQPWNPYSVPVSKDLRKGLWEERDDNEDYLEALKHYQLALRSAKNEGMDQLSLEYTGIVLKVAEMYQNLNMKDKLIETYYKLSEFIFLNLIEGKRDFAPEQRDMLIDRDLIVITRWAMLMEEANKDGWLETVETELKDRMAFIENHEIPFKFSWLYEDSKTQELKSPDLIELLSIWDDPFLRNKWIEEYVPSDKGKEFLKCWDILRSFNDKEWPSWIESYLVLREYYADLEMRRNNFPQSIHIFQSNILWAIVGNLSSAKNTSTQVFNLASCWFMYGQQHNSPGAMNRAESIYLKLSEVLKTKPELASNLAMTYYSLGVLYYGNDNKVLSQVYFTKAADMFLELGQTKALEKIADYEFDLDQKSLTTSN